jgi:cold shock CspA family protein
MWFSDGKCSGLISPEEFARDRFVRRSVVCGYGREFLVEGPQVSYDSKLSAKSVAAGKVQAI